MTNLIISVTSTSSASPRKFIIPKLTKSGGGPVATAAGDNAKSVLIKNQKETSTAVSKPEKDVAENSHSTTNGPSSTTPGKSKSKCRKKITFAGNSDLFALRLKIYGFGQKKAEFFFI